MFANDTIMTEVRSIILQVSKNSVLDTSVFVGNSNRVEEQIIIEKIERFYTHLNKILGFITHSRLMEASYSDYKRDSLLDLL